MVKKFFAERKYFRELEAEASVQGNLSQEIFYHSQQLIRKILINSMYGVLANKHFHYYNVDNARAITRGGRILIKYLSECTNVWFAENWHNVAHKVFDCGKIEPLHNRIVCVIDTDSNYLNLKEVYDKCANGMDFEEFAEIMETQVLDPLYDRVLEIFCGNYGREQVYSFKREGVITKQFVLKKKKYITELIKNEEKVYDPPKIYAKGVETVRSDTPQFCRERIMSVIQLVFDTLDKDKITKTLREIKKEFKNQKVEDISYVSGVKHYTKYAEPIQTYIDRGLRYKPHTPIHNRASICYNYLIKKNNWSYMAVANGTKIKYVYVKDRNIISTNIIGYVGNYPNEFNNIFEVDHDIQFEKSFLSVIQRMFDVLKWGKIKMKGNALSRFSKKRK